LRSQLPLQTIVKLVHAADIHLGRRRLDGRLPDADFAEAFAFVAQKAVEEKADVFLIAGDLFDRAQVEPPHLRQAQRVLAALKQARIPVIAIEGNHDKAFVHSEAPTWLHYLAEEELLVLLRTPFDANGPLLKEWKNYHQGGAWLDHCGVRFVGAGYLGAATPHKVRQIAAALEPGRTHVLLLHAGPEYFTGEGGGFSKADLQVVHERVCYLALGHIHKPMLHGDWACNPGSLENCDVREAAHPGPRGYAVVHIAPERPEKPLCIDIRDNPRRECHRLTLDCTPFGNKLKRGAEALVDAAVDLIKARGAGAEALVELRLTGKLNLERIALDQNSACSEIEQAARVRAVAIDTSGLNIEGLPAVMSASGEAAALSREDLEKAAIRKLVEEENLWGLDGQQDEFTTLLYELKEAVRTGRTQEDLAERISHSPLLGLVQKSMADQEHREACDERDTSKERGASAANGFEAMVQTAEAKNDILKG
jgi:DNA repair exonuclease SbcCD nuclease subunit